MADVQNGRVGPDHSSTNMMRLSDSELAIGRALQAKRVTRRASKLSKKVRSQLRLVSTDPCGESRTDTEYRNLSRSHTLNEHFHQRESILPTTSTGYTMLSVVSHSNECLASFLCDRPSAEISKPMSVPGPASSSPRLAHLRSSVHELPTFRHPEALDNGV